MNSLGSSMRANSTYWYPHTTEFKYRNGTLFGKTVEEYHDGKRYPVVTKYGVIDGNGDNR